METRLTIDKLEVCNFKNVKSKIIEIHDRSFVIIGQNEKGKSSIIDAILSCIDSKVIPDQAITTGEESGHIILDVSGEVLGEPKSYKIRLSFTQANGKGAIKLYNEAGEEIKASPKTLIKSLFGNVAFELDEFLKGNKQEDIERRYKDLKKLTGKEKEIDALDAEKKNIITDREELYREIKNLEGGLYNHGITDEEFERCIEAPKVEEIEKELEAVQPAVEKHSAFMERFNKLKNETYNLEKSTGNLLLDNEIDCKIIKEYEDKIKSLRVDIESRTVNIENAKNNIKINEDNIKKGEAWLEKNPLPNVNDISERLKKANADMVIHERIKEFTRKQQLLFTKKQEYENTNGKVEEVENKKRKVISSSNLPVKGMSFDENGITIDGLPFKRGQINTAKFLEINQEIVMAMNPGLKYIFIRDGSLYDSANLERAVNRAHEAGYKTIIEIVGDNEDLQIKWTEDYFKSKKK